MQKSIRTSRQLLYADTKFNLYIQRAGLIIFFSLLAIDIVFMGLHSLKSLGYINDPNFSVTKNFGYAESFQYLKAAFIAGCFIMLATKLKKPLFYCWAAVFTYILLDDSLELHEMAGYSLSEFLDPKLPFVGLGSTAGELIAFAIFGALLFIPLFYFYYKSKSADLKIVSQDLFILFVGLVGFGMGVDLLHDFAATGTVINGMLGLIEDGGEMIIMSAMVWYVWAFIKTDPYFIKSSGYSKSNTRKIEVKKSFSNNRFGKDRESMPNKKGEYKPGIPRS